MNLAHVAEEVQHRIIHIFGRDPEGRRATNGGSEKLDHDPHFRDYVQFFEVLASSLFNGANILIFFSSSMLMMDEDLAHRIKLDGK